MLQSNTPKGTRSEIYGGTPEGGSQLPFPIGVAPSAKAEPLELVSCGCDVGVVYASSVRRLSVCDWYVFMLGDVPCLQRTQRFKRGTVGLMLLISTKEPGW